RGFDGGLANLLDVHRVAERGEGVAIVNLEDFGHALADAEQENAFGTRDSEDGRAALELFADVFTAVANGFEPTIGFFGHELELIRASLFNHGEHGGHGEKIKAPWSSCPPWRKNAFIKKRPFARIFPVLPGRWF